MDIPTFISRLFLRPKSTPQEDPKEKRETRRVRVDSGHGLAVHLLEPGDGESGKTLVTSVRNVSLRGLLLEFSDSDGSSKFHVGQELSAAFDVEGGTIPMKVEVVRLGENRWIGIRFKPPFPKELERLGKYLEPRWLGLSMREINPSTLKQSESDTLRWFQGENDTNLFCWVDPETNEVIQQQLIFLERVVEWRRDVSVRTGKVKQENPALQARVRWVRSELLEFDEVPEKTVIQQAGALLSAATIDPSVKDVFLRRIT